VPIFYVVGNRKVLNNKRLQSANDDLQTIAIAAIRLATNQLLFTQGH